MSTKAQGRRPRAVETCVETYSRSSDSESDRIVLTLHCQATKDILFGVGANMDIFFSPANCGFAYTRRALSLQAQTQTYGCFSLRTLIHQPWPSILQNKITGRFGTVNYSHSCTIIILDIHMLWLVTDVPDPDTMTP